MKNTPNEKATKLINDLEADIDLSEETVVVYEVWAIGYDAEDKITGIDLMLRAFGNPDEAVKFAEKLQKQDIFVEADHEGRLSSFKASVAYVTVEVETVVDDPETCGTMNVGTIYRDHIIMKE